MNAECGMMNKKPGAFSHSSRMTFVVLHSAFCTLHSHQLRVRSSIVPAGKGWCGGAM
jgi:hypothetical protein